MSDKIRGALFNALGDIEGLHVLDAFAGSGALSFEAISRGAKSAIAIEMDKSAQGAIEESLDMLDLRDRVTLVRANCGSWSNQHLDHMFDIIVADPPYDKVPTAPLDKLVRNLKPGGLYVLSWPGNQASVNFVGLEKLSEKSYGDAMLIFYRRV
jgi:16S rRNA (guanine966-N2)-methyltransferase